MTEQNPLISRYLQQLEAELGASGVTAGERAEILKDIASHAAEAEHSGQPITAILEKLGPAEALARSYAAELFLLPAKRPGSSARSQLIVTISRAGAVCASLLLVVIMGTVGIGLTLSGVAAALAGIVLPFVSRSWLDPTLRAGLPQIVVIAFGLVLLIVGVLSLRLVRINFRMIVRALRRSFKER